MKIKNKCTHAPCAASQDAKLRSSAAPPDFEKTSILSTFFFRLRSLARCRRAPQHLRIHNHRRAFVDAQNRIEVTNNVQLISRRSQTCRRRD
jgi:hypothetical protein